jgi:hypothetical protein
MRTTQTERDHGQWPLDPARVGRKEEKETKALTREER